MAHPGGRRATPGTEVTGEIDWDRRHRLMRTHTALHVLCGVIWNEWGVPVTGGNMEPLSPAWTSSSTRRPRASAPGSRSWWRPRSRPTGVEVSFVPRAEAVLDEALIRTKVSLVPESVAEIRVVDIVGLDKQADGGTHPLDREVGGVRVVKTESKGKGNKRVRIEVTD